VEISITQQSVVFLFSCVVGGILGVFYDVFRIIRIAFNSKWLSIFFQDLIFCVFSAFSIILLIFYTNSGTVRWFSLLGCFMSFVIYHMTVGRLIMFASKKIIEFIKKILAFICNITVIPLKKFILFMFKQIKRLFGFVFKTAGEVKILAYYGKEKRNLSKNASKGFSLYKDKNNKIIYEKTVKNIGKITEKDSVKKQKPIEKPNEKIYY